MVTPFKHNNDVTERRAAMERPTFDFYLSHGLVRVSVCEIELSHIGKNNGNPDMVCENYYVHP